MNQNKIAELTLTVQATKTALKLISLDKNLALEIYFTLSRAIYGVPTKIKVTDPEILVHVLAALLDQKDPSEPSK